MWKMYKMVKRFTNPQQKEIQTLLERGVHRTVTRTSQQARLPGER